MKKIKNLLPMIVYFIILIISGVMIWRDKDIDGAGLGGILYFAILFPLSIFIISVIYSLKIRGRGKYFLVLFFGISIMLFEYIMYHLAYNKFDILEITTFITYGIISLVGILVGNLIKKFSKKN